MFQSNRILKAIIMVVLIASILTACMDNIIEETPPLPEIEPIERISYLEIGNLELPVDGATGYTSTVMELKREASVASETIDTLEAGTAFRITEENGDWWRIENHTATGWLEHRYCMINLPDVIPSIVYDLTNTYGSKLVSSGKPIPSVTGETLYEGRAYNERFGENQYVVLVLYPMAEKICLAQQEALKEGNSLKIYEAYRPYAAQKAILLGLTDLAERDPEVMNGINTPPWETKWFIATGYSNHQRGAAIDVSLVKVDERVEAYVGEYLYPKIVRYSEYAMPTQIHELSSASAVFTAPISSYSRTDWQSAVLADSMNVAAVSLQRYCTNALLTPLASEWWHFNDLDVLESAAGFLGSGDFSPNQGYSVPL